MFRFLMTGKSVTRNIKKKAEGLKINIKYDVN